MQCEAVRKSVGVTKIPEQMKKYSVPVDAVVTDVHNEPMLSYDELVASLPLVMAPVGALTLSNNSAAQIAPRPMRETNLITPPQERNIGSTAHHSQWRNSRQLVELAHTIKIDSAYFAKRGTHVTATKHGTRRRVNRKL